MFEYMGVPLGPAIREGHEVSSSSDIMFGKLEKKKKIKEEVRCISW